MCFLRHVLLGSCRYKFLWTSILSVEKKWITWIEPFKIDDFGHTFGQTKNMWSYSRNKSIKKSKSTRTFWRHIHIKLKTNKNLQDSDTKEQDFKYQLFWGHTYEIKNTFCGHLGFFTKRFKEFNISNKEKLRIRHILLNIFSKTPETDNTSSALEDIK